MKENKHSIAWGIILVLIGGLLLVDQVFPNVNLDFGWPWIVMGVGFIFLLLAILTQTGGLAIPGCIVGGIGGILYYQNLTGNWTTWQFAWALIPGFVGIGILIASLISPDEHKDGWQASLILLAISAVGFLAFGGGNYFNLDTTYILPGAIILVGLFLLAREIFRKKI